MTTGDGRRMPFGDLGADLQRLLDTEDPPDDSSRGRAAPPPPPEAPAPPAPSRTPVPLTFAGVEFATATLEYVGRCWAAAASVPGLVLAEWAAASRRTLQSWREPRDLADLDRQR